MFVVAGVALRQLSIKVYQEIGKILSMKVKSIRYLVQNSEN